VTPLEEALSPAQFEAWRACRAPGEMPVREYARTTERSPGTLSNHPSRAEGNLAAAAADVFVDAAGSVDFTGEDDSTPLVSTTGTRTLRRWVKRAADQLAADGDDAWREVRFHDLRRTGATNLRNDDVDPLMACDWGGWNGLEPFLEHYQGRFSPEAQERERQKVDWL